MVAIITKLVSDDNNNSLAWTILCLLKIEYMAILTRQEKERLVLELYNLGKTYREISKEARISPRDIGIILNKRIEEKTEGWKEEEQDNAQEKQQQYLSSTQAYKLFCEGKTPLEVAIELNLEESEATRFYKEYWNLKQLNDLNTVYEEIKDDIGYFVKLYKLAKAKRMGVQQVVDVLEIANNDLPAIKERFKRLRNDACMQQSQKHICERRLYQLKSQIATTTRLLNSFRMSCIRERREIENLNNEKAILEEFVTEFKNNNVEYLKLRQIAEDKVKNVLTNSKIFMNFATASVIESLKRNPELCNFIMYDNSNNNDTIPYGSNCLSLMSGEQQQPSNYTNDDIYTAMILEEAEKLYNQFITKLTNEIIAAAAAMKTISSLPLPDNNDQKLTHKNDRYQTEESSYNQLGIYSNDQEQPNKQQIT
jgi:hypothetical protein